MLLVFGLGLLGLLCWSERVRAVVVQVRGGPSPIMTSSLSRLWQRTLLPVITAASIATVPPSSVIAAEYADPALRSIERLERAASSLDDILSDIASKGDADSIIAQIKFLQKAYKLRETTQESLPILQSSAKRDVSKTHFFDIL